MKFIRSKLYAKQEAAIFAPERYAVIEASTKAGKTVGCLVWLAEEHSSGATAGTSGGSPRSIPNPR